MQRTPVPQLTLWALRLLAYAGGHGAADRARPIEGPWIRALGLSGRRADGLGDAEVQKAMKKRLKRAEADARESGVERQGVVLENVRLFASELHLDAFEETLLGFAVLAHTAELLHQAFQHVIAPPVHDAHGLLATVLDIDPAEIKRRLSRSSILWRTGLVRVGECLSYDHREPLQLAYGITPMFATPHDDAASMLARFFQRSKPARLIRDDYAHIAADVDVMVRLLRTARDTRAPGVNVLIHGPPGTGKTELVRTIAAELGTDLFEVNVDDCDGDPIPRDGRLSAYTLSQRLLARRGTPLVLFDELEDVFPRRVRPSGSDLESGQDKGWTNRILEDNPIPTLWVGNDVTHIDPAFLRRFDYALELRAPPARTRRRILERYATVADLPIRAEWLDRASEDERVTPAHIERAVRVTCMVGPSTRDEAEATLGRVLERGLALTGHGRPTALLRGPRGFDLSLIHASADLERVTAGLVRSRAGSICLFGPPGTGKTAFAHHLAKTLDVPLHARRASDLLSPFIGETEINLAAMFRRAREESAMVLLDEADSFFRSRARATQSWEITQVNEILVQMETFDGVFVCTTNLMSELDEASLRRFALKIRFDPPRPEQRWRLFGATLEDVGEPLRHESEVAEARVTLDRLGALTPGDFAVVARRAKLLGQRLSPHDLCAALADEARMKVHGARAIGFGEGR